MIVISHDAKKVHSTLKFLKVGFGKLRRSTIKKELGKNVTHITCYTFTEGVSQ